jgi:3-hydroxyisobutyrate dehydrogenase-like beta-hydroxyacid dehydrogenase
LDIAGKTRDAGGNFLDAPVSGGMAANVTNSYTAVVFST